MINKKKDAGFDKNLTELIETGSKELWNGKQILMVTIQSEEKMPREWLISVLHPIYKKGDRLECRSYRGIAFLKTMFKIVSNIPASRLEQYYDEIIAEYQGGFRKNRSTTYHAFTVRQIREKVYQ